MDVGVIGFIIFVFAIGIIVYLYRSKIERHGIILMTRTTRFKEDIKNLALKYKKFWKIYFSIGVVVSFFIMVFGVWYFIKNTLALFSGVSSYGLAIVLPYPTSSFSFESGVLLSPPWYWVIVILILLVPHEFSHAIAFVINKVRIKYLGLILFLFIPGAFAEPDENQLKKSGKWAKLQIFCAGSFSNIIVGLIFLLILNLFLAEACTPNGIYYYYPATKINKTDIIEMNNLTNGIIELKTKNETYLLTQHLWKEQENISIITVIEDWPAARNNLSGTLKKINNVTIYSPKDVREVLSRCKPNETIHILTSEKSYNITLAENNGRAFLGIITSYDPILDLFFPMNYRSYEPKIKELKGLYEQVILLLSFIIAVCIGVAIFNLLPMKPLDGGFVLETLTNKKISNIVSMFIFLLIVYNLIWPLIF